MYIVGDWVVRNLHTAWAYSDASWSFTFCVYASASLHSIMVTLGLLHACLDLKGEGEGRVTVSGGKGHRRPVSRGVSR